MTRSFRYGLRVAERRAPKGLSAATIPVGERFGSLVVRGPVPNARSGYVICVCDCGNERKTYLYALRDGSLRSCGRRCPFSPRQPIDPHHKFERARP